MDTAQMENNRRSEVAGSPPLHLNTEAKPERQTVAQVVKWHPGSFCCGNLHFIYFFLSNKTTQK